jgi:hypothetical protein
MSKVLMLSAAFFVFWYAEAVAKEHGFESRRARHPTEMC